MVNSIMTFSWAIMLVVIFGLLFFFSAVVALVWASRTGQLRNFEEGAKTIFDEEEEPEGTQTDFFPGEAEKRRQQLK
jgi:nitrogen fixation-related uncharacterized protein